MTVEQLIEILQDMIDDGRVTNETPVLAVHQPRYPLAEEVDGLYPTTNDEGELFLFVVVGGESREYGSPYGPGDAWAEMETSC